MHEKYMREALKEARKALKIDEVPVGAVVVHEGRIIGRGYNQREKKQDPLSHAEMHAIAKAAKKLKSWRLNGCTLYVTLEPCPMCAGAIINARIHTVVYGADDPNSGAAGSKIDVFRDELLSHKVKVIKNVLKDEGEQLIRGFFRNIREKNHS